MDHMRISGTEPSLVILRQTCSIICWKEMTTKVPKQAEAKRDGVITHIITISINFKDGKFWRSPNATNQRKSTVELKY